MERDDLTAYQLEQDLKKTGSKIDRTSIMKHCNDEVVPNANTLAEYADYFVIPTDAFYDWEP